MDAPRERQPGLWARLPILYKLGLMVGLLIFTMGLLIYAALSQSTSVLQVVYGQENGYYTVNGFQAGLAVADEALQRYLRSQEEGELAAGEWRSQCAVMETLLEQMEDDADKVGLEQYFLVRALRSGFPTYEERGEALLAMRDAGASSPEMYAAYEQVGKVSGYLSQAVIRLQSEKLNTGQETLAGLQSRIQNQENAFALLLVGAVLMVLWILWVILRAIVAPVLSLSEASAAISAGNFDTPDVTIKTRDEMYTHVQEFNRMKHSMKRLFQTMQEKNEMEQRLHQKELEASESQRLLEQARMQQLRSQVNPHFLFNTLNIIARTAQQEHASSTRGLILSLARLFRYSLKTDGTEVTLQREIKLVDDYMKIQHTRFENRVQLYWRIAPSLGPETVLVPAFVLQPIVENAVLHGLGPKREGGVIRIRAHLRDDVLHLIVSDNGMGMERDVRDHLLAQQTGRGEVSGIGVGNVRSRLQMVYPQARFAIHSAPGRGTCVHMALPGPHRVTEEGELAAVMAGSAAPKQQEGGGSDAQE